MKTLELSKRIVRRLPMFTFLALFLMGWYMHLTSPDIAQYQAGASALEPASSVVLWRTRPSDLLTLADTRVARELQITPEHYQQIVRIDAELDRRAALTVESALKDWYFRGGFHVEPIPNFRDRLSPYGSQLADLKREAAERILKVLSKDEKSRWLNQPLHVRALKPRESPSQVTVQ